MENKTLVILGIGFTLLTICFLMIYYGSLTWAIGALFLLLIPAILVMRYARNFIEDTTGLLLDAEHRWLYCVLIVCAIIVGTAFYIRTHRAYVDNWLDDLSPRPWYKKLQ